MFVFSFDLPDRAGYAGRGIVCLVVNTVPRAGGRFVLLHTKGPPVTGELRMGAFDVG